MKNTLDAKKGPFFSKGAQKTENVGEHHFFGGRLLALFFQYSLQFSEKNTRLLQKFSTNIKYSKIGLMNALYHGL